MRYAPGQKEKTRARILEAAGKVFRRRGYHAAGVDEVMEEAGLTAGGFYAHFASKQALLAEALVQAAVETGRRRDAGLEDLPGASGSRRSSPVILACRTAAGSKRAARSSPWLPRSPGPTSR